MKTTFKSADLKMSILSNVHRCWLAMPPVAGFLEMFAGVPYNREKNESLICRVEPIDSSQRQLDWGEGRYMTNGEMSDILFK